MRGVCLPLIERRIEKRQIDGLLDTAFAQSVA